MMSKATPVIVVGVICFFIPVAAASAQTPSRGRVQRDRTIIWRTDVSIVAAIANEGTVLEITAQSERWYEVVIPPALGGQITRGLIARSLVELVAGSPAPPVRALRGSGPLIEQVPDEGVQRTAGYPRGFLSFTGAYQSTTNDFHETVTFRQNAEDGHFETDYTVRPAPMLGFAAGGMISRTVGIGAAVTRVSRTTPAALATAIPHPFFFNAPRSAAGEITGLRREELGVHAQLRGAFAIGSHVEIAAVGGPSLFRIRQGIVTDFTYADSYPYDSVTFDAAKSSTVRKLAVGFNAGGDAAVFFTRYVGVGFTAMYSRAEGDLPVAEGRTVSVRAGGVTTGAGLRLRF